MKPTTTTQADIGTPRAWERRPNGDLVVSQPLANCTRDDSAAARDICGDAR